MTNQAAQGKNIKFSLSHVEDARRFANKIWNATRFVLMNLTDYNADQFADRTAEGPDSVEYDLPSAGFCLGSSAPAKKPTALLRLQNRRGGAGAVPLHLERHL